MQTLKTPLTSTSTLSIYVRVLSFLISRCECKRQVLHVLGGAFIVLQDNCRLYRYIRRHVDDRFKTNLSSHFSLDVQYRFGSNSSPLWLCGTKMQFVDAKGNAARCTWIQLENSDALSTAHITDYITHKITNRSIGRYGTSIRSEKNPLMLGINPRANAKILENARSVWKHAGSLSEWSALKSLVADDVFRLAKLKIIE
jgi:hypothetical protein